MMDEAFTVVTGDVNHRLNPGSLLRQNTTRSWVVGPATSRRDAEKLAAELSGFEPRACKTAELADWVLSLGTDTLCGHELGSIYLKDDLKRYVEEAIAAAIEGRGPRFR